MYRFAVALVLSAGLLLTTGCIVVGPPHQCPDEPPDGTAPCGDNNFIFEQEFQNVPFSAAITNSQQFGNSLMDTDATLTYVPNSSQLVITVATDNGQTFAQTFSGVPVGTSTFSSAAPQTIPHAFAPQNPQDISSFINSAASNASSTVTVNIKMIAGFQGPADGSQHTDYGRSYTPSYGVQNLGWVTYTAPCSGGGLLQDNSSIDPNGGCN
jgi:hypothetical protein